MKEIEGKTFKEAAANITRNLDSSKTYLVQLKNKSTNRSKKYILKGGLEDGLEKVPIISMSNLKINPINLSIIKAHEERMREELNEEEVRKQLKEKKKKEIENSTKNSQIRRDTLLYNRLVDKLVNIKYYIEEIKKLKNSVNTSNKKRFKLGPLIGILKTLINDRTIINRSNVDDIFRNLFEKYTNEAELVI